jgi:hypothetical protein
VLRKLLKPSEGTLYFPQAPDTVAQLPEDERWVALAADFTIQGIDI